MKQTEFNTGLWIRDNQLCSFLLCILITTVHLKGAGGEFFLTFFFFFSIKLSKSDTLPKSYTNDFDQI